MVPLSTTHFSLPLFFQPLKSRPLKSRTQSFSDGIRALVRGLRRMRLTNKAATNFMIWFLLMCFARNLARGWQFFFFYCSLATETLSQIVCVREVLRERGQCKAM